jgi:hypothetical protein
MLKRIALGTLLALCALALVTPAGAVTVNGVDFIILGKSNILMENSADCEPLPINTLGCMILNGNVGVSDPNGTLHIGANNVINGTATANHIFFGTNSHITKCVFNVSSGVNPATVCDTVVTPVPAGTLPIVAAWPPGPLGAVPVDNCVNAAADVTVNGTQPLAPGCYKNVRLNANSTLNLSGGAYVFKTLRMLAGSTLHGNGATVNVQGQTITESGVTIDNIVLESPGTVGFSVTEFFLIGNGSTLTNVVFYAPTAGIHLHTGFVANGIEAVANFITVEPGFIGGVVEKVCGCFDGVDQVGLSVSISKGQHLDQATGFFVGTTCGPAGLISVPASGVTPTTATLDLSGAGVPPGSYHVIAKFDSGSYCSDDLVVKP